MDSGRTDACITGIAEWIGDTYELCLFLVEKLPPAAGGTEFSARLMNAVYSQS